MSISPGTRGLLLVAAAMLGGVAWALWRPAWFDGALAWVAQEQPWLARLLGRYQPLLALGMFWSALREPRSSPALFALLALFTAVTLSELRMSLVLGVVLALLVAVALVARPRPNRVIMARCAVVAALAVGIDAAAG